MPVNKPTALNVRVSGALSDFVASNVGEDGLYENASEYVRDLIRRDFARVESERFDALKRELQRAAATPVEDYATVSADEVIARGLARHRR